MMWFSALISAPLAAPTPPWTPLVTPMHFMQDLWFLLLIPLALGISLVYKAMYLHDLRQLVSRTLIMTLQIVGAIIVLAIAVGLFVQLVIPMIPVA